MQALPSSPAKPLHPVSAVAALLTVAIAGLAACGGGSHPKTPSGPSAAEPAAAPSAHATRAGRTVRVGSSPEGIVVDPRSELAVVAVRNPAKLVLLDPRSGRVVRRIAIAAAPRHLQVARHAGRVLVPEEPANALLELSTLDGRTTSIPVGAHPHDATEVGGKVFVGDEFGKALSVIEGHSVVQTIGGFLQPGGVTAVGGEVAVVDVRADTITLIDSHSGRRLAQLPAGAGPTHVVGEADGRLYVIDTRGGAILRYDTRPRLTSVGRLTLPGAPYGVAIDPARHRLWVTLTAENRLVELDTSGDALRVIAEYRTGRQPNTVAVDERTGQVLIANAGAGTVQILAPQR